jgi:hypothetical protein
MFHDLGCHGKVRLGELPATLQQHLACLPGEWLEFDPPAGEIVVRRVQPASGTYLPTIAMELVRMLAELPPALQEGIPGGELLVHTEGQAQLVRLRVDPGAALHLEWARPDQAWGDPRPYRGRQETSLDPKVHRLDGSVTLRCAQAAQAARELQSLADTYEGLYPEGSFKATVDEGERAVRLEMRDANLDAHLLIDKLQQLAAHGSLGGGFTVSSFADEPPEEHIRVLFESGATLAQHPLLWAEAARV